MRILLPFLALYRRHGFLISLGIVLAIVTLLASIALLTLSGWFLAASALAGLAGLMTFNYMLPAAGVRGSAIIRTASRYAERVVSHDATFRVLSHLRVFTFSKLLPLTPGAIAHFRQAELLNRLVADIDTLDHLYLRVISPLIGALLVTIVVTYGLSWIDLSLALTLGGIMLLLLVSVPFFFYQAGKPIGCELTSLRASYRTILTSWLQGQSELVIFNALSRFRLSMDETEQRWLKCQQQQASLSALSQSLMILASGLTLVLMLWLAAGGVGDDRQVNALVALFVFITLAAFEALAPVAGAFQHLGQVTASAQRVTQLIEQKPTVSFSESLVTDKPAEINLIIHQAYFAYPGQTLTVLEDISLNVKPGEHIALLGKTGCGKSTLLQLITRAWDLQRGEILFNQQNIKSYTESALREIMSVVPQRVHIFSDTLRNNLRLAAPESTDEHLKEVLLKVGLGNLLDKSGLNQWLGDGGRQLSGGEQRRLGIARAMLHNAPLILLDEPTEGLDADTERQILSLLNAFCQHKTVLLITHRLSGLAHFDQIHIMDDGKIIESGTHDSLLAQYGQYYRYHHRAPLQ